MSFSYLLQYKNKFANIWEPVDEDHIGTFLISEVQKVLYILICLCCSEQHCEIPRRQDVHHFLHDFEQIVINCPQLKFSKEKNYPYKNIQRIIMWLQLQMRKKSKNR